MQPSEFEQLKKEMAKIFVEEFKKVNFKKLVEEVVEEVIKKKGKVND